MNDILAEVADAYPGSGVLPFSVLLQQPFADRVNAVMLRIVSAPRAENTRMIASFCFPGILSCARSPWPGAILSFTARSRNTISGARVHLSSDGGAPGVFDIEDGRYRNGTAKDLHVAARIVDAMENIQ